MKVFLYNICEIYTVQLTLYQDLLQNLDCMTQEFLVLTLSCRTGLKEYPLYCDSLCNSLNIDSFNDVQKGTCASVNRSQLTLPMF